METHYSQMHDALVDGIESCCDCGQLTMDNQILDNQWWCPDCAPHCAACSDPLEDEYLIATTDGLCCSSGCAALLTGETR